MELQELNKIDKFLEMSDSELTSYVRGKLRYEPHFYSELRLDEVEIDNSKFHRRFDMSGYGDDKGSCTIHNNNILNLFGETGIFDKVVFFHIEAYKGAAVFYYKFWEGLEHDDEPTSVNTKSYGGWGTVEIIVDIIKILTRNSEKTRRTTK